jgi:hypothetical protein
MSGPGNGYSSPTYPDIDRRQSGVPGRRAEDYIVRNLDPGPGQERRS